MCSSRRKALLAAASWAAREQPLNARKDDLRNPDPESGLLRETRAPPVCPRAAWRPVRVLRGPRQGGEGSCVNCAQSGLPAAWPPGPRALLRSQPVPALPGRPLSSLPAAEGPDREVPRGGTRVGGVAVCARTRRGVRGAGGEGLQAESGGGRARCPSGNFEGRVTRMLPGAGQRGRSMGSNLKIGPGGAGRGAGVAEVWAG